MHKTKKDRIVALYQEGHSIKSVAELTHHATVTILDVLHDAGVDTSLRATNKPKTPSPDWRNYPVEAEIQPVQLQLIETEPCFSAKERYYQRISDLGEWRYLTPAQMEERHAAILEIETEYRFEQLFEAAGLPFDDTRDYDEDLDVLLDWIKAHKG